jgi:hypothetical protein
MEPGKSVSEEELSIVSRFEALRKVLLSEAYAHHLNKPLAYWALPADHRLPLALLGRSLRDLLGRPLAELQATRGIGRKKMESFVQLLARAADTNPADLPAAISDSQPDGNFCLSGGKADCNNSLDPDSVSEVAWARRRETVMRIGLSGEVFGRLAPSLKNLTRALWTTPLGDYASATLTEIRARRAHGEKRLRAVLEVFHAVHAIAGAMDGQEHLSVRIAPRLIDQVEQWVGRSLQRAGISSDEEIFGNFVSPLLEQIRIDAEPLILAMAECRLGIDRPMASVRQAARSMGLTRARAYQLLNDINDMLTVRWPMGRHQVHELREKFRRESAVVETPPDLGRFHAAVELFYPGSRRGADGPLDRSARLVAQDRVGELMAMS